jgi:hypothetical protein
METVELISISRLSTTMFEVKLLVGRDLYDLTMEVQTTDDQAIVSVRPSDLLRSVVGPDMQPIRPIFDAVRAFWRAQKQEVARASEQSR